MAVCSVVYEEVDPENEEVDPENKEADPENKEVDPANDQDTCSSSDEIDCSDDEEDSSWTEEVPKSPEVAADIKSAITKVTKIVNKFRRSPKLWEKLLKRTQDELGEPLGLKPQCKTRWSSMFFCLQRFYTIRDSNLSFFTIFWS